MSDLVNRLTAGNSGSPQNLWFHKQARIAGATATAPIAGRPASLWLYDGSPGPGAAPTTVAVPDNTTNGGLKQTNPAGAAQKWLVQGWATGLVGGTLILYDRLSHNGNLSGTTTGAQTFSMTPTRYTDGVGNIAWAEIYTIVGTTATTISMSYTDQGGTSSNASPTVTFGGTGFREVTRAIFLPLVAGDSGIQSIQSVTLTATTGTAGAFGVTLAHPLAYIGIGTAGGAGWRDFSTGLPGIPEIKSGACLSLLWVPITTTAPEIFGAISTVDS
jgi:hypothetical protein